MEELLSQLLEDMIGSGLKKEDPGRPSPPFCSPSIYREVTSPGTSSEESMKRRCVVSLKQ
jgi:hypothetical protein